MRKRSTAFPPHIFGKNYYKNNWDLIVALIPTLVAGALSCGVGSTLLFLLISIMGAALAEIIFSFALSQSFSLDDGWSVSLGLLTALLLPPSSPLYIPALVAALGVLFGKAIPGGLGKSVFSPLPLAFILAFFLFPGILSYSWPSLEEGAQTVIRAKSWLELFLMSSGNQALGSYSLLAILLGTVYLILRNSLSLPVTLSYLLGASLLLFFPRIPLAQQLFANDALFFAVFLVPLAGTAPLTIRGKLIYGFIAGLFSVPLRLYLGPVLGLIFSLPFANALVPLLNFILLPKARKYLFQKVEFSFKRVQIPGLKGLSFSLPPFLRKKEKSQDMPSGEEKGEEAGIQEYKGDVAEFCSFCTEVLPECGDYLRKSRQKGWQFFHFVDPEGTQGGMILAPLEETPFPVEGKKFMHLSCLMVRKERRKQGIGRALVDLALKRAGGLGISVLGHKDLIPPSFLEHLGFKNVAKRGPFVLFSYGSSEAQVGFSPSPPKTEERREKAVLEVVLPPYCSFLIREYRKVLSSLNLGGERVEISERLILTKEEMADFPYWGIYLNRKPLATGLMESERLKEKVLKRLKAEKAEG